MLSFSLLLLAAAPAPAPGASPVPANGIEALFEGCQPAAIQGGGLWNCNGLLASVSDVGGEVEAAARAHLAGMRASLQGEVNVGETEFTLGDKSWPGYGFKVTRPPDPAVVFEGTLLAFKTKGVVRLVTCGAVPGAGSARCPKILAALAENGAPASLKPGPNDKAKFVDQELETPPGCKLTETSATRFQLTCGQTAFLSYLRVQQNDELAKVDELIRTQLLKGVPGAKQTGVKDCKLGGVATKCTVIEAADAVFFIASAVVKGAPVSVHCGQEKSRKGFHPVCAKVLSAK